ncbi:MAG: 4Fe-4S ferredoxin, partial [Dehalococcoidia bacterium]
KKALYINALVNITRSCDCDPHPGPIICPDIGYLASNNLAAIDGASLQLIHEVKPGAFQEVNQIDPLKQVRYAQEIGLIGSYELRRL